MHFLRGFADLLQDHFPFLCARMREGNVLTVWRPDRRISADGSRILTTKDVDRPGSLPTDPAVVVNWFAELDSKVPE